MFLKTEPSSGDMKFNSQKEDRVAAALLPVGRFARILKSKEYVNPLRQVYRSFNK